MDETATARIDIEVVGGNSADRATASLDKLAAAGDRAQESTEGLSVETEKAAKIRESSAASIERLARQYDKEYAMTARIEKAQRDLNRAFDAGLGGTAAYERAVAGLERAQRQLSGATNDNLRGVSGMVARLSEWSSSANSMTGRIDAWSRAQKGAGTATEEAAKKVGLARHEWINLSRQFQDVGVSLAGGASPFMVLTQQGGQIADVFSSSGAGAGAALKDFGGIVLRIATHPVTLLAGALGVATLAALRFENQNVELERSLNGVGRAAGVSRDALRQIGERNFPSSPAQGVALAGQFAGAGIAGGNIGTLVGDTRRFANAFGLDMEKAGDEIASIVSDTSLGAMEKRFGAVDFATKELVRSLEASGRHIEAQAELTARFDQEINKAKDSSSELAKIWEGIKTWAATPVFGLGPAIDRLRNGPTAQQQLEEALRGPGGSSAGSLSAYERRLGLGGAGEPQGRAIIDAWRRATEETAKALRDAVKQESDRLTTQAGVLARQINPEAFELSGLKEQRNKLRLALGDPETVKNLGEAAGAAREALDHLNVRIANWATALQRYQQDTTFSVAAIEARTLAEKEAVAAQKAYTQALRETGDFAMAEAARERERATIRAEARRRAEDALLSAKDQAELGRIVNPFEREMKRIDLEMRDLRRDTELPNATQASRALDSVATSAQSAAEALGKIGGTVPMARPSESARQPLGRGSDPRGVAPYIRERAGFYGIDPEIALRVARSEGLGTFVGDNGSSFGAFQLHRGGIARGGNRVGGLGDEFMRQTGLDPANPANERETIDFALRKARQLGWGPWHGAARAGIGEFEGIGGSRRGVGAIDVSRSANDNGEVRSRASERATKAINDETEAVKRRNAVYSLFEQDLDRSIYQVKNEADAIEHSTHTLGLSGEEITRATVREQEYTRAKQAGITVTEELRRKIEEKASAEARKTAAVEQIDNERRAYEELRSISSETLGGILTGLRRNENAGKILESTLERIADRLAQMALDSAINQIFPQRGGNVGSGLIGLIGGLIGNVFPHAEGGVMTSRGPLPLRTYAGGGIASTPQLALFGEGRRPEAYVPLPDGRSIPVTMRGGNDNRNATGGNVVVNVHNAPPGTQVKESSSPDGGRRIDVVLAEMVAGTMDSHQVQSALRSQQRARRG